MTKTEAFKLWEIIQTYLPGKPCNKELVSNQVVSHSFSTPTIIQHKVSTAGNATLLLIHLGKSNPKNKSLLNLIATAIDDPFYSEVFLIV